MRTFLSVSFTHYPSSLRVFARKPGVFSKKEGACEKGHINKSTYCIKPAQTPPRYSLRPCFRIARHDERQHGRSVLPLFHLQPKYKKTFITVFVPMSLGVASFRSRTFSVGFREGYAAVCSWVIRPHYPLAREGSCDGLGGRFEAFRPPLQKRRCV